MTEALERFDVQCGLMLPDTWADFVWSDWDPYEAIVRDKVIHPYSFVNLTPTAHILFALGCAEMIIGPIRRFTSIDEPTQYLDAFWLAVFDARYAYPLEIDFDVWEGREMGMCALTLSTALNTVYGADEGNSEIAAAFSYQVLQHAFGRIAPITDWALGAIETLERNLSRYGGADQPLVLPPDLLCPNRDIPRDQIPNLCAKGIAKLKIVGNPYINRIDQ